MTPPRFRTILAAATLALIFATPAFAQDGLTRAKTFYASADYEEALQALAGLSNPSNPEEAREIAAYRVFCLVALNRNIEARMGVETIVKIDPLYHPSEAQASPRIRAFFEDARRPLLPEIMRDSYSKAKDAFERKEMPVAAKEFDTVIALIDELGPSQGSSDMRTLAAGFRDLAKAATPPPPPPKPAVPDPPPPPPDPKPVAPPPPADRVYTPDDPEVIRPVAVSRVMPSWSPANDFEARQTFKGVLEMLIDERGRVVSATMTKSVRPAYDAELLKAVKSWSFKPAMRKGLAVKYVYRMEINVGKNPQR
jgi:TonB family protein